MRQCWQDALAEISPDDPKQDADTGTLTRRIAQLGLTALFECNREQLDCIRLLVAEVEGPHKQSHDVNVNVPMVQLSGIFETEENIPDKPITEQNE